MYINICIYVYSYEFTGCGFKSYSDQLSTSKKLSLANAIYMYMNVTHQGCIHT